MAQCVVKLLLLIFGFACFQAEDSAFARVTDNTISRQAQLISSPQSSQTMGSHTDGDDCGCTDWPCKAECQRCSHHSLTDVPLSLSPKRDCTSTVAMSEAAASCGTWISKALLDPPRAT